MVDKMVSLDKSEAWDVIEFPVERKNVGRKGMVKNKLNA